jgi:hypothetical protein
MFAVSIRYSVIHRIPQTLSIILGSLFIVACGGGEAEGAERLLSKPPELQELSKTSANDCFLTPDSHRRSRFF